MHEKPFFLSRRALALALPAAASLLLAACGSRPRRSARARGGAPAARATPAYVPATAKPLNLPPAGREASVAQAMLLVNTPYRYGGNTPDGGFDCSGLVHYVYGQVASTADAHRLPRSTAQWAAATTPVDDSRLQRGDLVFFNTSGRPFSHMGIYVGGGQFVHAPSSGGTVRKDSVDSSYFGPRYLGARSVFAA